jgi:hypothetical protein
VLALRGLVEELDAAEAASGGTEVPPRSGAPRAQRQAELGQAPLVVVSGMMPAEGWDKVGYH